MDIRKLDHWHQTKKGLLVFGLVELAITYGFASWAIDSANLLSYLFSFIFGVGAIQNIVKLVLSLVRSKKQG